MHLEQEERRVLLDVLNIHLEGMDDAKEQMMDDTATLTDLDSFAENFAIHQELRDTIEIIKKKVVDDDD